MIKGRLRVGTSQLRVIKHRSGGYDRLLQSAWRETCSNNLSPSGVQIWYTRILECSHLHAENQQDLTGLTHPCGGFLSSQPALMTGVMGVEPPGSPSMGCGGSSGIRRLLGRDELRLLVCHPPLGKEERE